MEAIRETSVRRDFEYSSVEITLAAGQGAISLVGGWTGMVGFRTGGVKCQIDAAGLEHQDVTKAMLCSLRS